MSRIGKKPVTVPTGVTVSISGPNVTIKGPKGELIQELTGSITASLDEQGKQITVQRGKDLKPERAKHGLYRSLIANMVEGVTKGYERRLEIQGVGYRAELNGKRLRLFVGFNTKVPEIFDVPEKVTLECPSQTEIVVTGTDKQLVGQVTAQIRSIRPPDVYKGKGIRYKGEQVRKLPGKTVGATGS